MATVRMTAKWNGTCPGCKKPTLKDSTIEYDYETKKAWHPECRPGVGNPREVIGEYDSEQSGLALAEQLHFVPHADAMDPDRPLFLLSSSGGSPATRWD